MLQGLQRSGPGIGRTWENNSRVRNSQRADESATAQRHPETPTGCLLNSTLGFLRRFESATRGIRSRDKR